MLGFASGLPLALTGQAMQAWLSVDGVDVATIGFLSLVGLPYTFKFLWAPLMDRFELPWLGRRRGWLVLTQLALAGALVWMADTSPTDAMRAFALLAGLVAFISASQDVVIDAYRTDLLPPAERGLGSSLTVLGYRLAMILSGGIALIWVDAAQGGGWTWPEVYRFMAWLMVAAAVFSATLVAAPEVRATPVQRRPPRCARLPRGGRGGRRRLSGQRARSAPPLARWLLGPLLQGHLDDGAADALDRSVRAAARPRVHAAAGRLGGAARRSSRPCSAGCAATSRSPAPARFSLSSCSTSSATRSPAR